MYTTEAQRVLDHDFAKYGDGFIVPHGIYDVNKNIGYMTIGTSKDTSEFNCDCIEKWWLEYGRYEYPNAEEILILADGGGSNSSRTFIFKEELQKLCTRIGMRIRMAHYPPYTSKYNPIEHRLFSQVTRVCQGVVFSSVELVNELMSKTKTTTGLKVFSSILDKVYKIGKKVSEGFRENMSIKFDDYLGKWNYVVVPDYN